MCWMMSRLSTHAVSASATLAWDLHVIRQRFCWEMNERRIAWINDWMNNAWISELTNECNDLINEWMDGWMHEWINEWMNEWMNERIYEWINEWMTEQTNERTNERTNGWMNKQTNGYMNDCMIVTALEFRERSSTLPLGYWDSPQRRFFASRRTGEGYVAKYGERSKNPGQNSVTVNRVNPPQQSPDLERQANTILSDSDGSMLDHCTSRSFLLQTSMPPV